MISAPIVKAEFGFDTTADYTGEAFYTPPSLLQEAPQPVVVDNEEKSGETVPPIKLLRQKFKNRAEKKQEQIYELAPTASDLYSGEVETSEYASKEVEDNFEEMTSEEFEIDEDFDSEQEEPKKRRFFKRNKKDVAQENSENIVLDCEKVDYDTQNYLIKATGDVSVLFVKQNTTVKADVITFDRISNTIKAEGDVRIVKGGKVITGDYIFVDMNEENAIIENPYTISDNIVMRSKKGIVYGDRIVQEDGTLNVQNSFPINFHTGNRGPQMRRMLLPKSNTLTEDMSNGIINLEAKEIKITQKGDLEIISFKKPRLYKGDRLIFKTPSVKFYTNKNHDYIETDHWEVGSIRGLGLYAGPGFVAPLPKGSVFKFIPMVNYKSGFGIGALGRFSSGTNHTMAAYGTAVDKVLVYGKQDLDDDVFLHYSVNSYMPEWFMGRRRPKYGAALVYEKGYTSPNFILKGHRSEFKHRIEGGYFQDLDFDSGFEKIGTSGIGTTRFRYMAQVAQNFYSYINKEEQKALSLDFISQLSSAIYGTGDTQVVGRVGPMLHTQYKRWMQDLGYYFAVMDDNTPMRAFDQYRYGQQSLYIREYYRICRWLTLSWFGMITLSNDSPNGRTFQENSIYFSFGPDDLKLNLGYDFERDTLRCTVEVMMDAKGTNVEYEKLEIKQDNKTKKAEKKEEPKKQSPSKYAAPVQQPVLERAVVENVKVHEDVL